MKTAILCVDDEKLVLDSLRIQLSRHFETQHLLEFAQGAEEGLEVIADLAELGVITVLIISDWMMPGMKGDEFLKRVRELYPQMTTMILTGQADETKLMELQLMQVTNAVMNKPWKEEELICMINQLLTV
ncbi:MAG: response regulator [Flavobacteriales bacterium]|nr:response regulator [Flavobacteriales bacterium]